MRTSSVLVPLEAWAYSSPFVRRSGFHVDLGLLADALIYYDHVYIVFSTPEQLAEVLRWFQDSSVLDTFLGMLADDVVTVYRYDFFTGATWANDSWSIWNLQGPRDLDPIDELDRLVLERPQVRNALGSKARIRSFRRAVHDHAVIVESDRFGSAIEESRKDMLDTEPVARAVQALYDEVYRHLRVGEPPEVHVTAVKNGNGKVMLNLGVDLTKLANMLGPRVDLRDSSMIAGFGQVNHLLLSASDLRADLMLPNPLATMASAKLNQGFEHADKLRRIVSELVLRVDFPDVRNLVRSGRLDARTVLKLRSKAGRFRAWLQDEASMDADAVLAYHGEMARESRVSGGTRLLHLFGTIGGSVLAGTIGAAVGSGPVGGAAGGLAGGATQYLVEILQGLNREWRPAVFGDWARAFIQRR